MRLRILAAASSLAILCALALDGNAKPGVTKPGVGKKQQQHKHAVLHNALFELKLAAKEVQESKDPFAGYKSKALGAINSAVKNIEAILIHEKDNFAAVPARGDMKNVYKKYKRYPHLQHALHEVQLANKHLRESKDNFGGHRAAAERETKLAAQSIEKLLRYARKPGKKK